MIRQYCEEDLSDIADLVECFEEEHGCFKVVGGFSRSHFLKALKSMEPLLKIWVRESEEKVVSALAMVEFVNPYSGKKGFEELFWFSLPEYRGNHENTQLLDMAEIYAVENKICYMAMSLMEGRSSIKIETLYKRHEFFLHQKQYFRPIAA